MSSDDISAANRTYREAKKSFNTADDSAKLVADDSTSDETTLQDERTALTLAYSKLKQAAEDYQPLLTDEADNPEAQRITAFLTEAETAYKDIESTITCRLQSLSTPPVHNPPTDFASMKSALQTMMTNNNATITTSIDASLDCKIDSFKATVQDLSTKVGTIDGQLSALDKLVDAESLANKAMKEQLQALSTTVNNLSSTGALLKKEPDCKYVTNSDKVDSDSDHEEDTRVNFTDRIRSRLQSLKSDKLQKDIPSTLLNLDSSVNSCSENAMVQDFSLR